MNNNNYNKKIIKPKKKYKIKFYKYQIKMSDNLSIKKENFITHKKTNISKEYILGKIIGEGDFAQVRLAIHKATKQVRAVKIMKKGKIEMEDFLSEISILSKLTHPSIMQIYEIFEDNINLYIVSEFCKGGELFDIISDKGNFTEKEACLIMQQLLSAVCYSHQNGIVHRDIKPENILLESNSKDFTIKIVDWGSATKIKPKEKLETKNGSPYYIAPEVLKGEYNEKCDIWSCGVILYILLCGYAPFFGESDEEIFEQVLKCEYDFPAEEWDAVSNEAKNLIKKMIEKDPNKRISALEALQDDWFKINKTTAAAKDNKLITKNVINNMKKFKKNKKFEQAIITFIINQLIVKEDRKDLERQFKEWDKNGDGVLSRDEIFEGYKKTYGTADENEIDNMIKSIDLDGNGVIDYNEFLTCAMNKDKILKKENLELCFKAFDADNSGTITIDEISAIFHGGHLNKKENEDMEIFKKMIRDADENGDGKISLIEFKDLMRKFFI